MQRCETIALAIILSLCSLLATVDAVYAEPYGTMASAGYQIFNGGMSSLGGSVASAESTLMATNMYPYQLDMTLSDYADVFQQANADLTLAKSFLDSITPIDKTPSETGVGRLLLYPKDNYESVPGLLSGLPSAESQLVRCRDIFAYGAFLGYPQAQEKLRDAIKTLASIYFLIADEFLIDALEFRFSNMTIAADAKLDEQICQLGYGSSDPTECTAANATLHGAQSYYEKLLSSFVYGFSPSSIGRTIYISMYFDADINSLFNLAVERYSLASREKVARMLARQISPDPVVESNAKNMAGAALKNVATGAYLISAAVAQKQGDTFISNGGDRITNALSGLRSKAYVLRDNINPLGYDNRYVPMQSFDKLKSDALSWYNSAKNSQNVLMQSNRDFEANINTIQTALMNLVINPGGYKSQLATLTGISVSDPTFDSKVILAGDDLYSCDIDAADFIACTATKTKGILGGKYSQIREAQIRVDQALLKAQHLQESIDAENKRQAEMLTIRNKYNTSYQNTLKDFLDNMKNARTVERTKIKRKGKDTESQTVTSFKISDPSLKNEVTKAIDLQQALYEQEILTNNLTDGITIMNMTNNWAESQIEIGLAIQMKNSALLDFENSMKEKENLTFLYGKAKEQISYDVNKAKEKLPELRILHTQAALDYSASLSAATHYTYLAAKSLEYKYLKPLNVTMPGGETLSVADIYKVQTAEDIDRILNNLSAFDSCSWGSVSRTPVKISLAYDILGLTNKYLNPTGTLTTTEVSALRKQKVRDFIAGKVNKSTNSLTYEFSTSLNDFYISKLNKFNMKIWWGTASPPCDPVQAGGVAVNLITSQVSGLIGPYVTLSQRGHSTYYDKDKNILEYIPVSEYLNMQNIGNDSSVTTTGSFFSSINTAPVSGTLWDPSFKGRSVASSNWQMTIEDIGYELIDWTLINDIELYIDTIASTYQ